MNYEQSTKSKFFQNKKGSLLWPSIRIIKATIESSGISIQWLAGRLNDDLPLGVSMKTINIILEENIYNQLMIYKIAELLGVSEHETEIMKELDEQFKNLNAEILHLEKYEEYIENIKRTDFKLIPETQGPNGLLDSHKCGYGKSQIEKKGLELTDKAEKLYGEKIAELLTDYVSNDTWESKHRIPIYGLYYNFCFAKSLLFTINDNKVFYEKTIDRI